MDRCLLLLGHTDGLTTATSGLGVLSTNTDTPVMTKTTMGSDLLQTFQIFTHFVVQEIGHNLVGLAVLDILLPVEEPIWDLVLPWVLHDGDNLVNLFLGEFSSTLGQVNVGLKKTKKVLKLTEIWEMTCLMYSCFEPTSKIRDKNWTERCKITSSCFS